MRFIFKGIILILFLNMTSVPAQDNFKNFLSSVSSAEFLEDKTAIVDSFMNFARSAGIPFIENNTANFIYVGAANKVALAGDMNFWDPESHPLQHLNGTDFFYISLEFEPQARLDYKFVLNGSNWILDPENPSRISGGFGPNSQLLMPGYIPPWEINFTPDIPHGELVYASISSSFLQADYHIRTYLPPGYDPLGIREYPSVFIHDGVDYISLGGTQNVLDNLIHEGFILPVIAVFIRPNNRNDEYGFTKRFEYEKFIINELVPYVDSNYNTENRADKRLIMGASLGGYISAQISYHHPEIFGNCGLQSCAFWPNDYEIYNEFVSGPKKEINIYSVWGSYEGSLSQNMRTFDDICIEKGYDITSQELPEGHSWGLWRATTDDILMKFFPADISKVHEVRVRKSFYLSQNYPNPFNPVTTIRYELPSPPRPSPYQGEGDREGLYVSLIIYDILGNEIKILVDGNQSPGVYEVEFDAGELPSGIYLYKIQAGKFTDAKKMIILK